MNALVFDVGMHNGDDTAYYLARGYKVVAVEANPELCTAASARFSRAISSGQLLIRNVGIAETRGEMEFWVSDHSEFSSFQQEFATRSGFQASSIKVDTIPFAQLVEEEGVPFFVKIDIEMSDSLCLKDLAAIASRPKYLSFESNVHADTDIGLLRSLGYRSFKCVRQNDWREITPGNVIYQEEFRRLLTRLERLPDDKLRRVLQRVHYRSRRSNGWEFKPGSSGPLSTELNGHWLTGDEILSVWHQLIAYDFRLRADGLGEWFDIHAAHESTAL